VNPSIVTTMSSAINSVTSSLKVAVKSMVSELVGSATVVSRDTVGILVSTVTVAGTDAMLELPARSAATFAAMNTITVPSEDMPATLKVYVRASTVTKLDAVRVPPLAVPDNVMSPKINSLTSSLNSTVNGTVSSPVLLPADELTETVGAKVSMITVTGADTVLELPAESAATSAAIDAVTVPSVVPRATSNVYVRASTVTKLDAAGLPPFAVPVTVMSPSSKFLTASLKVAVNVTGSSLVMVPSAGVMVTVGTRVSMVTVTGADAVLELPAESAATSAAIDAVTVPSVVPRATSKVYVLASTVTKLDAVGVPPFAVPVTVCHLVQSF